MEARRKAELEEEEKRLQGLEELRAQAKAEANMKVKDSQVRGKVDVLQVSVRDKSMLLLLLRMLTLGLRAWEMIET